MTEPRSLPCGCRICGCMCAEHAPNRMKSACSGHTRYLGWFGMETGYNASPVNSVPPVLGCGAIGLITVDQF